MTRLKQHDKNIKVYRKNDENMHFWLTAAAEIVILSTLEIDGNSNNF